MNPRLRVPSRQHGVAAVEFALIAALLFTLLIGIMEFSRITFYWNAATEATRLGARLAIVCDLDDSAIKTRMHALFPVLAENDIDIEYAPAGCATSTCEQVRVSIDAPEELNTYIPGFDMGAIFPPFVTTLPRESMRSSFDGADNPVCM
ncbi:TadE family protein [Massilia soli]|uniref:Pilus assembly protein n=1 Tax=Massilia soli TaxID=2792854 RepID=A0ABS7SRH4_9BURK|nr:TadE family protein [Massilia soli]MBZ2208553.1 pilus assembly protein [Massilia soli]